MPQQLQHKSSAVLRADTSIASKPHHKQALHIIENLLKPHAAPATRRYLFLQGIASPFFSALAESLRDQGHETHKIIFCLGDKLFWRGGSIRTYRGRFSRWAEYIRSYIQRENITDIVLFGDCRPYHAVALAEAKELGITPHVFEEGYYRPNWLTLEKGAVNAGSTLPRDPETIRILAEAYEQTESITPVENSFSRRAVWDIAANVTTLCGIGFYPFFRHHRPINPVLEYLAWIPRLLQRSSREQAAEKAIEYRVTHTDGALFLLPLQLDSDYQIRNHSTFRNMAAVIEHVVSSFATSAPEKAHLIIKVHPLDNGLVNHRRKVREVAKRYGITSRVDCIDGGNLGKILLHASGVVVVNSTVGLHALRDNRAVKVLGNAFYDIPGITSQQLLDDFWRDPHLQDRQLYRAFHKIVMHDTQVNGGYYCKEGIALAVKNVQARLARKENHHA